MKKQVFNPYLPSYEYIPDGEPRVLFFEAPLSISKGKHPLYFTYEGNGYMDFKSFVLEA